jgi:predicted metalloprotease with PDZ domain
MKKIQLFCLFLILANPYLYAQVNNSILTNYNLRISKNNLRLVDVEANMTIQEPYLEMNPWGIPPEIEKGWAKFVDIKSISDEADKLIEYTWNVALKRWDLKTSKNTQLKIKYQVRLEHDNYNWDAGGGIDGRPTVWNGDTLFWVTKALFVYCYGDDSPKKAKISFDVPKNWKISTAWTKVTDKEFIAENIDVLDNNLLVLGNQTEEIIKIDNMSILLVTPKNFEHQMDLLNATMKEILPVYKNVFSELPMTNYLICISENDVEDGEAYKNSFHQMFKDVNLKYRKIIWGNTFAHEMFHYWTGLIYNKDFEGNYWFSEGFTDYYSSLALIRSKIIPEQDYLKKLAFQFSRFHSSQKLMKEKLSLVKAGKDKINNWHLIYGGGATMAFILDVEIRSRTNGVKTLDDFMKKLYFDFGKKNKPFNINDQINILNNLTNSDFNPIFKKFIKGTDSILEMIFLTCEKAGIIVAQFQSEFYLTPKEGSDNNIYNAIIKK